DGNPTVFLHLDELKAPRVLPLAVVVFEHEEADAIVAIGDFALHIHPKEPKRRAPNLIEPVRIRLDLFGRREHRNRKQHPDEHDDPRSTSHAPNLSKSTPPGQISTA